MRSFARMAATTVILAGAWACGSDNNGPSNTSPVANFTAPACTVGVACTFTDASSDPDGTIASRGWDFGDGTTSQDANPTHTFAAAQTYQVTLTVTDNGGATNAKTVPVTVTGGTGNVPPTAAFTAPTGCTVGSACAFTDASTDTDGAISAWEWNFGDGTALATDPNPTHQFGAEGTFTVSLKVTDDKGATATTSQPVTVGAASAQNCTSTSATVVICSLSMTQKSTATITLNSTSCEIGGNRVAIALPRRQNVFFNVCSQQIGQQFTVKDANGAAWVFNPGDQLQIEFTQGQVLPPDPTPVPPSGTIAGTSPSWTVTIEDGGNPNGVGEPDFNDVVLGVQATVVP
jgi:PKD repeat protein